MIKISSIILLFSLILITGICNGQTQLSGYVYSAKDSTALFGASVYFDGTSIGVSTNSEGYFQISSSQHHTSPLIISSLGYETLSITKYGNLSKLPNIYLKEKAESLDAIVLETDPWSRRKKLAVFRREFLGNTNAASKSKITNEEVLTIRYSPRNQKLTASAATPLIIKNRHLGYTIHYNLNHFEVNFSIGNSGLELVQSVYFEGSSFFKELRKRIRKKFIENRKQSYLGSGLHFMRALSAKKLDENDFKIFHDRFQVPPYKFFKTEKYNHSTGVELLTDKISILYKNIEQSSFQARGLFYIDELGNHSPPQAISYGGEISRNRMANTLPLDYQE